MKKLFLLFAVAFALSANAQDVIVVDGQSQRADNIAAAINGYLQAQGKVADVRVIYSNGYNDPSGKTVGETDATWTKVAHAQSGVTRFVQQSNSMEAKISGIINDPTSNIAAGNVVDQFCTVQSTALKAVADQVGFKKVEVSQKQDCGCAPTVVVIKEEPKTTETSLVADDFEVTSPVPPCEEVQKQFDYLQTLLNMPNSIIKQRGFKNKKAVKEAMMNLALNNPSCLEGKFKKDRNGNWALWAGGAVVAILAADAIEGNGIDLFGLLKNNHNKSSFQVLHTEPDDSSSQTTTGTGGVPHNGTGKTANSTVKKIVGGSKKNSNIFSSTLRR